MYQVASRFALFCLFAGLLLGCQGDRNVVPSEPGSNLDLASACKDATFLEAIEVYEDNKKQNKLEKACQDILKDVSNDDVDAAELKADQLLVDIHVDYQNTPEILQAHSGLSLTEAVAFFIDATCGLIPSISDTSECLEPNDIDENGVIEDFDLDGWMAAGPLDSGVFTGNASLATGVLPNDLLAFGVSEANGTFVIVSRRSVNTVALGDCPLISAFDCQNEVWEMDVDLNDSFEFVIVETGNTFGDAHMACPEEGGCEFGEIHTPILGLVGNTIDTKFGAFSPIVPADTDPRVRGVVCTIESSTFNAGSEGTLCEVFDSETLEELDECTTEQLTSNSSQCTMSPPVPGDIAVFVTAEKTDGDGAYNAESDPFSLGPTDPARGGSKEVCFAMEPPNAQEIECD